MKISKQPLIAAVIPARMAATRFPNKPLVLIAGIPLVEHVRRRVALNTSLHEVVVATCDQAIKETVESFGGKVIMTADSHEGCIDRVAEAAEQLESEIIVNVQGDEPLMLPELIDKVVAPLIHDPTLPCSNLMVPILDDEEYYNPNAPKVVVSNQSDLLYISREPIPSLKKCKRTNIPRFKQTGIIAFRRDFLRTFATLSRAELEDIESVDILRAVCNGYTVRMIPVIATLIGVDAPENVTTVESLLKFDPLLPLYR